MAVFDTKNLMREIDYSGVVPMTYVIGTLSP